MHMVTPVLFLVDSNSQDIDCWQLDFLLLDIVIAWHLRGANVTCHLSAHPTYCQVMLHLVADASLSGVLRMLLISMNILLQLKEVHWWISWSGLSWTICLQRYSVVEMMDFQPQQPLCQYDSNQRMFIPWFPLTPVYSGLLATKFDEMLPWCQGHLLSLHLLCSPLLFMFGPRL